jgi:inhibitor of cysteine peptidase
MRGALAAIGMALVAGAALAQDVIVRLENSGAKVTMNMNQALVVHLERNASTGFRWQLIEPAQPLLKAQGLPTYDATAAAKKPGASSTEIWRLNPVRSGQQEVRFEYRRPWEKGAAARVVVYKVTVR